MKHRNYINDLFYDDHCGTCRYWIQFLKSRDPLQRIKHHPLQGAYAQTLLPREFVLDLKTVVFFSKGRIYTKSDAVIRALYALGGIWRLAIILRTIPRVVRDFIYDWIAEHRH